MDQLYPASGRGFMTVSQVMSAGDNSLVTGDNAYMALDNAPGAVGKACGTYGKSASWSFIPSPTPM